MKQVKLLSIAASLIMIIMLTSCGTKLVSIWCFADNPDIYIFEEGVICRNDGFPILYFSEYGEEDRHATITLYDPGLLSLNDPIFTSEEAIQEYIAKFYEELKYKYGIKNPYKLIRKYITLEERNALLHIA